MKLEAASLALILSVLVSAMPAAAGSPQRDIVDTVVATGNFNTLATAVQAASLTQGTLHRVCSDRRSLQQATGRHGRVALKPENKEKLKAILLYHVVSGDVTAAQV